MTRFTHPAGALIGDANGLGHMDGWGWGMAVTGWFVMLVMAVAVGWLVASTARHSESPATYGQDALDTSKNRYARGEIDRGDYLARKDDLVS